MTPTMARQAPNAETMLVSAAGEAICLGFANTLAWRGSAAPIEALGDFAALLAWAETHAALPALVAAEAGQVGQRPALEGRRRRSPRRSLCARRSIALASALASGAAVERAATLRR